MQCFQKAEQKLWKQIRWCLGFCCYSRSNTGRRLQGPGVMPRQDTLSAGSLVPDTRPTLTHAISLKPRSSALEKGKPSKIRGHASGLGKQGRHLRPGFSSSSTASS